MTLRRSASKPVRILLLIAGFIFTGLAFVGIVLPLIPTTPFLLLAAASFLRSSNRFHHWLTHHRIFGPYLYNYRHHRAMSLRSKILAISLLWLTIGWSAIIVASALWLQVLLLIIALGVSAHLLRLKTMNPLMALETKRYFEKVWKQ